MKNLFNILMVFALILISESIVAQGNPESVAKDVIKAYKTKDVDLLKKHMTGMMLYVINDGFFNSDDGKPLAEIASKWDGTIKEIRYSRGDIMGKDVLLASAYFSDNPNGNLNVVILSSFEKSDWKAFAYGITDISKAEFDEGSKEIPSVKKESVVKEEKAGHAGFSIDMASGETFENPSTEKLVELLKTLNDDNFFLTLNSKNGFMQTSTSEKGYIVQYSNNDGMFEAESYFTMDMLIDIFKAYIEAGNWKEKATWVEM